MKDRKNRLDRNITINWEQYHLNKVIDSTAESIHHIIWKSLRQEYNTNEDINKMKIKDRQHVALNRFFNSNQAPHLQLRQCLELWEPVLSEWVREELYSILKLPRDLFYDESLVKGKYKWKSLFSDEEIYKNEI